MSDKVPSRREFVESTAKAALAAVFVAPNFPMIVPRHVLGGPGYIAPSDQFNFAVVGFGGMGSSNAETLAFGGANMVAVCDADLGFSASQVAGREKNGDGTPRAEGVALRAQFDRAAKYADFREMLDKQKDIDGVVIATPDHNHAIVAKSAMQLGKHVYVQKPLTSTVHEARVLAQLAADNPRIVTQMGNQGHSSENARFINEWVHAGLIGKVHAVDIWTNRPIWPQGVPRPLPPKPPVFGAVPSWGMGSINALTAGAMGAMTYPPPKELRWDLYLGGVPEELPYHPVYHPFNWRGWLEFGVGAIGDMGAHLVDHPFWALDLGRPTSVEATSTPWGTTPIVPPPTSGPRYRPVSYPQSMVVHYAFAARGKAPPVKLSWYDGGLQPPRPDALPDDVVMNREGGVIFHGEKGILLHETYGANPRLYPAKLMERAAKVHKTIPRVLVKHEFNWVNACQGNGTAVSPFSYAAKLTETMLLGIVALRAGQGRKILYDADAMRITNVPEANAYLTREYRAGWEV